MPAFDPPKMLNGIPLSERSRQLLYTPVAWLVNPKTIAYPNPFQSGGWVYETFVRKSRFDPLYQYHLDYEQAHRMAVAMPGTTVTVNGASAFVAPKRWDELLFGLRLF